MPTQGHTPIIEGCYINDFENREKGAQSMIIVASDVHLGYDKCNYGAFTSFLNKCNSSGIDHLVLLGDLLDFWRRNSAEIIMDEKYAEIFNLLDNLAAKDVHYIVGNHDYHMLRLNERYEKEYDTTVFPFTIRPSLRLLDNGSMFYFIHGYELEVLLNLKPLDIESYETLSDHMCSGGDIIGGLASHMWDIVQRLRLQQKFIDLNKAPHERGTIDNIEKFAESKGAYMLLGMKHGEKLVFGHTHKPFINDNRTVANSGAWVNEATNEQPQNTYVKISNGQMELKTFDEKNFP